MLKAVGRARVTDADVQAARERISPHIVRTPLLRSNSLDALFGGPTWFKCENLQRGGAFKMRGALNAVLSLPQDARERGLVTFSSGNHGKALSIAARIAGTEARILVPRDVSAAKLAGIERAGGRVAHYDRLTEDRQAMAFAIARDEGHAFIHPFDDSAIIAGQATAALEVFEDLPATQILYAPVGGGGLASGLCVAARAARLDCEVVGAEPEAGDDVGRSVDRGEIVTIPPVDSICDGALTTAPGHACLPILIDNSVRMETVADAAIPALMLTLMEELKVMVEPTACLGVAAALADARAGRRPEGPVAIILSGGNITAARFCEFVRHSKGLGA
ncbi:MAG: threonine/serine dehydratase [Pseudomonadota bacterium]